MKIVSSTCTNVGRRKNNEDALCAEPGLGLFAVADGMGGYEGGEVASQLVIGTLMDFFRRYCGDEDATWPFARDRRLTLAEDLVHVAVKAAHQAVSSRRVGRLKEMGSTLAALALQGGKAIIGHVGDSRVYRLRAGQLCQLTRDHSLYEEMRSAGMANMGPKKECGFANVITRALGLSDRAHPDLRCEEVYKGDVFLLCTDGLTEPLSPEHLQKTLCMLPPERACTKLVDDAYEQGGKDNITAVVVKVMEV